MVGHRIKVLRSNLGLSQEFVAEEIGVSQSTMARIEMGEPRLTLGQFYILSDLLQVNLSDFNAQEGATNSDKYRVVEYQKLLEAMLGFCKVQIEICKNELK